MSGILLSLEKVNISYKKTAVVHDVSFQVKKGEILAIVGESGSGKSTVLKGITGLLGPTGEVTKGEIFYKGENLLKLSEKRLEAIRGKEIGTIFQNSQSSLCSIRTIGDQTRETIRAHKKISKRDSRERALELLRALNFHDPDRILSSYPFELSGGMNQRVGIMMAMVLSPSILLADEPTSALDVIIQAQVINELKRVNSSFKTSIIFVTHNIGVAASISDRVAVMKDGRIIEIGEKDKIINSPQNPYTQSLLAAVPRLRR